MTTDKTKNKQKSINKKLATTEESKTVIKEVEILELFNKETLDKILEYDKTKKH